MLPKRKNIRLNAYDYSEAGYYFVTICTESRKTILGRVVDSETASTGLPSGSDYDTPVGVAVLGDPYVWNVGDPWGYSVGMPYTKLSQYGEITKNNIIYIKDNMEGVDIDCFCIMPNHAHLIIQISTPMLGSPGTATPTGKSLSEIINGFKGVITRRIGKNIFQRNYYEHIIRDEWDLHETRKYILENPLKRTLDKYFFEKEGDAEIR
ncbi:MAG: transposase [Firmicutes bacterium]|nr:transposase [Bacillota bacterium]